MDVWMVSRGEPEAGRGWPYRLDETGRRLVESSLAVQALPWREGHVRALRGGDGVPRSVHAGVRHGVPGQGTPY